MPVKRRMAKRTWEAASDVAWALMLDEPLPDPGNESTKWEEFVLTHAYFHPEVMELPNGKPSLSALWQRFRDEILTQWAEEQPGTRPSLWWRWDAPRLQAGQLGGRAADHAGPRWPEPRRRLGGIGTPNCEVLNYGPSFHLGVPTGWVSAYDAAYYNGRCLDVHGNRIGIEYHEGHFKGLPPDPFDPPLFEGQAVYLDRHGLLLPGERERLIEADFEPEAVIMQQVE